MKEIKLTPRTPEQREEDNHRIEMLKILLEEQKAIENELNNINNNLNKTK